MIRTFATAAALTLWSTASQAQTCPEAQDHSAGLDALIMQVQKAETQSEAQLISSQMWSLWTDAPDARSQALLDRGMARREAWDLLGALEELDQLVAYCPNYAEGYNQRAFVNFLRQDFASALVDLDKALDLSPKHIAAMSGRALTLLGLKRVNDARTALSDALHLNPWLSERALLAPGGALEPPGEDI